MRVLPSDGVSDSSEVPVLGLWQQDDSVSVCAICPSSDTPPHNFCPAAAHKSGHTE